jgi:hypothetical protein
MEFILNLQIESVLLPWVGIMDGKLMSHLSLGVLKEIDGATNIINETSAQEMQAFLDGISNKFHSMNILIKVEFPLQDN